MINRGQGNKGKKDLAVYIHFPFCEKKCRYCDFCSSVGTPQEQNWYLRKLETDIRSFRSLGNEYLIRTIYFGGGTPSLMEPIQIMRILLQLKDQFLIAEDAEITMECNPGTLTEDKLAGYRHLGVNRLSIGLQSANDKELKLLGRIHSFDDFVKNYRLARKLGFRNINVDLMQSLPGQTLDDWRTTLEKVVQLLPEHISAYSLSIEPGTPFYNMYGTPEGAKQLPDEQTDRAMYHFTGKYLAQHGYHRYEISNYARGEKECRHNLAYWTMKDYIGFGQSAASYLQGKRFSNPRDPKEYRLHIPEAYSEYRAMEPQTVEAAMEEYMFLGLRLTAGISEEDFYRCFGVSFEEVYGSVADSLVRQMVLKREWGRVFLTDLGIDVSNQVLAHFLF